ncbi:MAG: CpsD/CapB family tyrosine-protein kinase [Planctomycetes bacterium]|nr:CpsD/CapB family tyrosine-protein kinase [Planctomycetota bacterium]
MASNFSGAASPLQQAIDAIQPLSEDVWTQISSAHSGRKLTRTLFTSPARGSGTTVMAAACGMGLGRNLRQETTVVETNLLRPALSTYLGLPTTPGLSDVLVGRAQMSESRFQVPGCPSLFGVPAGSARPAVPGEFADERAQELLQELSHMGRHVIFDAPPITEHSEVLSLLPYVDAVVLVVRARSTRKVAAQKAIKIIRDSGVPLIGTILNRYKSDDPIHRH